MGWETDKESEEMRWRREEKCHTNDHLERDLLCVGLTGLRKNVFLKKAAECKASWPGALYIIPELLCKPNLK